MAQAAARLPFTLRVLLPRREGDRLLVQRLSPVPFAPRAQHRRQPGLPMRPETLTQGDARLEARLRVVQVHVMQVRVPLAAQHPAFEVIAAQREGRFPQRLHAARVPVAVQ